MEFVIHKGAEREALEDAFGERQVTTRVLSRRLADCSCAPYVQVSVAVPSVFESALVATREAGVLGLDFNARGVACLAIEPVHYFLRSSEFFTQT